jgi:hypothetical protein
MLVPLEPDKQVQAQEPLQLVGMAQVLPVVTEFLE